MTCGSASSFSQAAVRGDPPVYVSVLTFAPDWSRSLVKLSLLGPMKIVIPNATRANSGQVDRITMKFREFKNRSFEKVNRIKRNKKIARALNSGLDNNDLILFLFIIFN